MKLAVDSSSFAKRYVQEIGSKELEHFLEDASEVSFLCCSVARDYHLSK